MLFAAIPLLVFDLTTSDEGWVDYGSTGQWEWAEPTSGPVGLGAAWGTNPDGLYLHDATDFLEVPLPDVSAVASPTVTVEHWYAIEPGDRGEVQLDAGGGFVRVEPVAGYPDPDGFVGASGRYVTDAIDLQSVPGASTLRFALQADPTLADEGWFVQRVVLWDGDVVPPTLSPVTIPEDTQDLAGPYDVVLLVEDDAAILDARVHWSADGGPEQTTPLVDVGAGLWQAELPAQPPDTVVTWHAEADDAEQTGRYPEVGDEAFRVFLAAPTELSGPDGPRLVATDASLTWRPPLSPHPVLAYHVFQEGRPTPIVVSNPDVTVPLAPGDSQLFTVSAEYPAGLGDDSEPVQLDIEVPEILSLEPDALFSGQGAYVTLTGTSLYLLDDETTLDLGSGVTVSSVDVRDVGQLTARVEVAEDAPPGLRQVRVTGAQGELSFSNAFEVLDGADAPGIRQITPSEVEQGDAVVVQVTATDPFASPDLVVEGDEDIVITGPVEVDGKTATFGLAVNTRARIGAHTLVLDDGVTLWTVDLLVDEYVVPPSTGCATVPGAGWGWLALLGISAVRRRRIRGRGAAGSGRGTGRG